VEKKLGPALKNFRHQIFNPIVSFPSRQESRLERRTHTAIERREHNPIDIEREREREAKRDRGEPSHIERLGKRGETGADLAMA
jgi:hypothetical protein